MKKLLTQLVEQYVTKHEKLPEKIVVAPVAALSLGIKHELSPIWQGVPIEMRLFQETEVVQPGTGTKLGVFVKKRPSSLVITGCELR